MKKDLLNTLKILTAAAILSLGISALYAWTPPTQAPPAGNVDAPVNIGNTDQVKSGGLGVGAFTADNASFNGNVTATGNICDDDGCVGPAGSVSWGNLTGIPEGFADNTDNVGISTFNVITVSVTGKGRPTANCPGGYTATGGGADQSKANYPVGNGWAANAGIGRADTVTVYVRCIRMQ